jgi:hypothetical protein
MDRYEGTHTALSVALHGDLQLAIIMDRYGRPHTDLNIALHGALYIENCNGPLYMSPHCPYYSLAWRPLLSHYNGPL